MIDFILYESDKSLENKYRICIYKLFGANEDEFKIYNYQDYDDNNSKEKIYILSSFKFDEVIRIAKHIRNNNDYTSPIIIISNLKGKNLNNELLILSYIGINDNDFIKLKMSLEKAYDILIHHDTFNFIFNKTIYRIPLKNILYIKKQSNSNFSIIHTEEDSYEINCTIKEIYKKINCIRFMKVHRSCIVNLDNVVKYDFWENIIYFKNTSIDLISRDKRIILKEKILDGKRKIEK